MDTRMCACTLIKIGSFLGSAIRKSTVLLKNIMMLHAYMHAGANFDLFYAADLHINQQNLYRTNPPSQH